MPNAQLYKVSQKQVDMAQAKEIVKLSRKVSKLAKVNKTDAHFIDVAQTLTPGTTPAVGYLTPIATGDTENNRDGDSINLRYLQFKATLVPNSASASDACRIMLFRWKSATNGFAPSNFSILEVPTNIDSPLNRDFRESMVVLYDKKHDISSTNGTKHIKLNKVLHNAIATYTGGLSTNYNENQIWFYYLFTDNTNKATINYYSRITFSK